jgi:hypothetical protein
MARNGEKWRELAHFKSSWFGRSVSTRLNPPPSSSHWNNLISADKAERIPEIIRVTRSRDGLSRAPELNPFSRAAVSPAGDKHLK